MTNILSSVASTVKTQDILCIQQEWVGFLTARAENPFQSSEEQFLIFSGPATGL